MHKRIVTEKYVKNLPRPHDDLCSPNIPIPRIYRSEYKECERLNRVPYPTPDKSNRESWSYAYNPQLHDMYKIVGLMVEGRYPKAKINWDDPKYYRAFNKLIHHCSSQYITPHIDERDDEITSKELCDDDKGWEKQRGY